MPFVGERLAKKIWEIVQTGHLQRLDHLDEKTDAMDLFCNLWGAGPKTAEAWVAKVGMLGKPWEGGCLSQWFPYIKLGSLNSANKLH